jgi:hypothetical protein
MSRLQRHQVSVSVAFKGELSADNPVKELVFAAGEKRKGGLPRELGPQCHCEAHLR